ncbi:helix-turn-helix transcriptional regulator [Paenibacillus lautus]|uniref:helix-turn-helix domain-containing protein n=1 Tax=Paenibacillus lautus TaxID=1401 RepID=UPI003D2DBC05
MIVNHISEIMGRKRLKVAHVAAGTGLAINTVSGLYHGTAKRVDLETLDKLATFLEVSSIAELLEFVPGPGSEE